MATNATLNGVVYSIPAEGDSSWGANLSAYFIAIASSVLQKTGGTFTLTADADFGASKGLKSLYYTTRATNPASAGNFRLGNAEFIKWRNAANSADLGLKVNASDALEYNGIVLGNSLDVITGSRASPSLIIAGTGIAFTGVAGNNTWFIAGSGSAIDISASPQIVAGTNVGQRLTLIGRHATNTVQLDDGSGLSINGSCILAEDESISLFWDSVNWVELGRSN